MRGACVVVVGDYGKLGAALDILAALPDCLLVPEKDFDILLLNPRLSGKNMSALYRSGAVDVNIRALQKLHAKRYLARGAVLHGNNAVINVAHLNGVVNLCEACEKADVSV